MVPLHQPLRGALQPIERFAHRGQIGLSGVGQHELIAYFTGQGPHTRDYRRGTTVKFDKAIGAKYIELKISDRVASLQPEFVVRQWE